MKATAEFSDPSEALVTISLTGTLSEFEDLKKALGDHKMPYWQVGALVEQIGDASFKLRTKVTVEGYDND